MKWEEKNRGQCSEERTRQDKAGQGRTIYDKRIQRNNFEENCGEGRRSVWKLS